MVGRYRFDWNRFDWYRFDWPSNLIWDATTKRWRSTWRDQPITLELNDDGGESLETVRPVFEAALKLEQNAHEHLSRWIKADMPELTGDEISDKLRLFHLGCEADSMIWFLYATSDLLAHSGVSIIVTLHEDGRLEKVGFLERH